MKAVFKHHLQTEGLQVVDMPFDSSILSLETLNGRPYLYVMSDTTKKMVSRKFRTLATGKEMVGQLNETHYIGTYFYKAPDTDLGVHEFHVFEEA